MTILKDWMQDAANEIERQHVELGRMSRVDVSAIIRAHAPFKPDATYMPVPRCDGCRHWGRPTDAVGVCALLSHAANIRGKLILTALNFGCVRWEAK